MNSSLYDVLSVHLKHFVGRSCVDHVEYLVSVSCKQVGDELVWSKVVAFDDIDHFFFIDRVENYVLLVTHINNVRPLEYVVRSLQYARPKYEFREVSVSHQHEFFIVSNNDEGDILSSFFRNFLLLDQVMERYKPHVVTICHLDLMERISICVRESDVLVLVIRCCNYEAINTKLEDLSDTLSFAKMENGLLIG